MKPLQLSFLLFLLPIISTHAADDDAIKKDLQDLQGTWTMVSGSADGQDMPEEFAKQMRRVFTGNELTVTMGERIFFKAKVTVDPTKKPKTIDYEVTEGLTKGKRQFGIYELEEGKFKSSFAKPDAPRPEDFKPGEGRTVSTWTREKK